MKRLWRRDITARDIWPNPSDQPTILINGLNISTSGSLVVHRQYCRWLNRLRPHWRLILLHRPDRPEEELETLADNVCVLVAAPSTIELLSRTLWERRNLGRLCRRLGCDLYFSGNGVFHSSVPVPQCLLIQDPSPYVLRSTGLKTRMRSLLLRRKWAAAVRKAACMGYTSRFMRSLVVSASGSPSRDLIAYNGIDEGLVRVASQEPLPRNRREPFILSVSAMMPHKNFETMIRAFALLRKREEFGEYRLRVIGRDVPGGYAQRLQAESERLGVRDRVAVELDRPWQDVVEAYRTARLFCLMSLCESFGLPLLEAMAHGTPVVSGDRCAMPEICGDAAVVVTADSPEAVADAWSDVLLNPDRYRELQNAGARDCVRFTWANTVSKWIEVMEDLLATPPR